MAEESVPVDLTNPGQVFACLGFVEAAGILLGNAFGGFDWQSANVRFRISAHGDENPIGRVLRFLDEVQESSVKSVAPANSTINTSKAKVETEADSSGSFPNGNPKSDVLPARLTDTSGNSITIDYWADDISLRRDRVKFWAGAGGYPGAGLARDALNLIHEKGSAADHADDPFSLSVQQKSSFRFDWRRDYVPIDAGFSPNKHGRDIVMQGYPIVELLAAIGMTYARPLRISKNEYKYGVAGVTGESLYDPIFLRAALGSTQPILSGMLFRLFTMRLDCPGQHARCITNVIEETQIS